MKTISNNDKNYRLMTLPIVQNSSNTLKCHELSCIILNGVLSIYNFGPWRPSCGFKFALWSKLGKGQNEVVAASSVSIPFQIEREFFWHGSLLICQLLDINGIGESIFPLSHSAVYCPRNLKSNYNIHLIQLCANNFCSLLKANLQ